MEREPASELPDDPETIGRLIPRIVQRMRNQHVDRVVGLLGDHEAAGIQEREEVRNEGGVIHTKAHGPYIGTPPIVGDSEKGELSESHTSGVCQRDRRYSAALAATKAAAARSTTVPPGGMSA